MDKKNASNADAYAFGAFYGYPTNVGVREKDVQKHTASIFERCEIFRISFLRAKMCKLLSFSYCSIHKKGALETYV